MSDEEKKLLKTELIEIGWWRESDPGDPTTDWPAAHTLIERMQSHLAPEACLLFRRSAEQQNGYAITIDIDDADFLLGAGNSFCEATCFAARRLQEFLIEHPECCGAMSACREFSLDYQAVKARIAEIEAIKEVIAELLDEVEMSLENVRPVLLQATRRLAKLNAYQAFTQAGGAEADFEKQWPGAFAEALNSRTASLDR